MSNLYVTLNTEIEKVKFLHHLYIWFSLSFTKTIRNVHSRNPSEKKDHKNASVNNLYSFYFAGKGRQITMRRVQPVFLFINHVRHLCCFPEENIFLCGNLTSKKGRVLRIRKMCLLKKYKYLTEMLFSCSISLSV